VHVIQGDRADAAALPDVAHAHEYFPGRQPELSLPLLVHAKIRGYLQDAAEVEHHRANHHAVATSASTGNIHL
jgi:antitoxin component HigA of HigAB toxin-antitoxin module